MCFFKVTPEIIISWLRGRGLICCSLESDRCNELGLDLMVGKNTDVYGTSFTVSVDLKGRLLLEFLLQIDQRLLKRL